ncbi:MAG: HAMP domain-containing sensor histidine kinase, partial [Rhodospirillaceae bacterium]
DEHNIGDFRVGAHAGTSVINQPIAEITAIFIALAMVLLPLTVFGSILLTRRTLAPLRELADLSRDIAEHKTMLRRLTHAGDDELGQVASAFNHMIDELKSHQTNLEALVDRQTQSLQLEIKERKDAEKALIEAKNQSELASRAKSELIANMSHELRTPLNAVIGFSESLLYGVKGPLASEDQAAYVRLIQESGTHLLSLINDILDVSAIEAGKLQIDEDWHSIKPIIDSVCLLVGARARDGDVTLHNQAQDTLPLLLCDERRIKQVLLNILSNAIKFTPAQGTITLSTELRRDGLLIQIADTGIGMDESQLEVAMSVFGQVDSGLNRKSEGTGLGLPLTKSLVDMHHSQLLITSTPGVGTTVGVLFPCERLRQAPQDSLSTVRLA